MINPTIEENEFLVIIECEEGLVIHFKMCTIVLRFIRQIRYNPSARDLYLINERPMITIITVIIVIITIRSRIDVRLRLSNNKTSLVLVQK